MPDAPSPVRGLFVTGTDTGAGKTYVAALIAAELRAAGHRVGVYKPVASGCRPGPGGLISDDALALWQAAGSPGQLDAVCPQRFAAPLAPHLAARAEGKAIDPRLLRTGLDYWRWQSDVLVVEGVGGLMSPIGENEYVADLAAEIGFPLVIVTVNALGTINQTLLTIMAATIFHNPLSVAGLVLNQPSAAGDPSTASNSQELRARCAAPLLAEVPHGGRFDRAVDWYAAAAPVARRSPPGW